MNGTTRSKDSRGSAPHITRVDDNPFQDSTGWQAENSLRPGQAVKNEQFTPPQLESHRFYASPANLSKDSLNLGGSPNKKNKFKDQSSLHGSQDGPMGMT